MVKIKKDAAGFIEFINAISKYEKSFNKLCSKLYANFTSIKKCTKYSKIDCCEAPCKSLAVQFSEFYELQTILLLRIIK